MRLGISGTYSSGKTFTAMAVSHYLGLPRTQARTMREILPEAAPGKTLEECTAPELIQMIMIRHIERVLHETRLASGFVSDGSSLQEWIYGSIRVVVGINPNASAHLKLGESVERTEEIRYFEATMVQLGMAMKRHVKSSFDVFIHLRNELPLAADGHRPVNDNFRTMADKTLLAVLDELNIPYHVVSGTVPERLERIAEVLDRAPVMSAERARHLAEVEYAGLDTRDERSRATVLSGSGA